MPTLSINDEAGKTVLATINPTTLLAMFDSPLLAALAQQVEDTMATIIKEAAADKGKP